MPITCRFYEQKYPELEEQVMVSVRNIQEMGAYVHLLEYKNIEGMILLSELSRRRIRSVNKLIRVGRNEVVVVIRVDREKGYIDLSKRRVSADEIIRCEEKFSRAKSVNSILRHTIEMVSLEKKVEPSDEDLESLYQKTAWYFDRKLGKPGACYDSFKAAIQNSNVFDECGLDEVTSRVLLENIRRRLMPQPVKIRTDIEVSCFTYEGIESIRASLRVGLGMSTEEMPIKISLIAPPSYVVTTVTLDRSVGLARVGDVIGAIKAEIEKRGGKFTIKTPPRVVSDRDEEELKKQLAELENQNKEVSGDEDLSTSEDAGDDDEPEGEHEGEGEGEVDEGSREKSSRKKVRLPDDADLVRVAPNVDTGDLDGAEGEEDDEDAEGEENEKPEKPSKHTAGKAKGEGKPGSDSATATKEKRDREEIEKEKAKEMIRSKKEKGADTSSGTSANPSAKPEKEKKEKSKEKEKEKKKSSAPK